VFHHDISACCCLDQAAVPPPRRPRVLAVASLLGLPPRCPNGARPLVLPRGVRPLAAGGGALAA